MLKVAICIYASVYESLNKATYKICLVAFQVRGEDGRKMVTLPIFLDEKPEQQGRYMVGTTLTSWCTTCFASLDASESLI